MNTVSVIPTVETSDGPPRVRLDVTAVGVTVTRIDSDGSRSVVRTPGGNQTGLLYDYEMPYGSPVSYSTLESPTVISAQVTVAETDVWLIHLRGS